MRILGIIAEYDPFHLGHAYQLTEARRRSGADYIVVVMSTCFTQRGEAALLSPAERARMALMSGADAVIALPALWAVRDAEHFALCGVHLLHSLGCDAISFGCETEDLALLKRTATALETPSPAMLAAIHGRLDAGWSYPAAVSASLQLLMPEGADLLSTPNNMLAVCYLRAMLHLDADMEIYPIHRSSSYHATELSQALPSATALRSAILRGDWQGAAASMPANTYQILLNAAAQKHIVSPSALDQALLYRLRSMSAEDYQQLPGLSEGIEDRLRTAAAKACSREELLTLVKTKRYPYARLSRLVTHALLGLTQDTLEDALLPQEAWLLGFRKEAQPMLHQFKQSSISLVSRTATLPDDNSWFTIEKKAYDIWCLAAGLPAGLAYTQQVQIV